MSSGAHQAAVVLEFVLALLTLVATLWIVAPYGRHLRPGWGPSVSARIGWMVMESPAVLAFAVIFLAGDNRLEWAPWVMFALWQVHYLYRCAIYPLRLDSDARPLPWLIVMMAVAFNGLNAWVNAGWIGHFGEYPVSWLADPRFLIGLVLFLCGMAIHLWADRQLLALRRQGQGYQLPSGGLFDQVCCPNYLGEIIQWTGWAILTWSWGGLAFAVYTVANLAPRALAHRRWYRERFPDFPAHRKALVPYLV